MPKLAVRGYLGPLLSSSLESIFQSLVSQFASVNSLDFVVPALGFASGVALYLSRSKRKPDSEASDIGEWVLLSSPTPFNRFVILRCPSISFEGSELLEDVNERLVKEDRHFVRLNDGRIQARGVDEIDGVLEEKLVYQRFCVGTDDGGVISLDWPANLDLKEEHGLDTTLLLIPGTVEGSMDKNVRQFVCESLKRGYFPVVMNPRGCAGSPLTTPRLFTAADSDDIRAAIEFINGARPWTTLMGVGWGYGANMLTKYLAEVGERTPLTAATCINNPFDLEEATKSYPHCVAIDQNLTGGLVDIMRCNQELFQGRRKGFDVEKALVAKSVRDFDEAISMLCHGCASIKDFYSKASTRNVVGNVKIPVLFIQNDDGAVPLFSVPRSLITENPFTSLLLCSCVQSSVASRKSVLSWCQQLTVEWLTAVELGLLKGRHPLLKDVDITVNPSKSLALVKSRESDKELNRRANKLLDLTTNAALNEYSVDPIKEMLEESDTAVTPQLKSGNSLLKSDLLAEGRESEQSDNDQTSSADAKLVKEEGSTDDNERGQVLQTAQAVMNMLDVTMPNTLSDEQKNKVLTAVNQGETIMKALQDAVPEDVRGKLTTAVSGIMRTQGKNLNFDGLWNVGQIPSLTSGLGSKFQETVKGSTSDADRGSSNDSSDKSQKSVDPGQFHSSSDSDGGDISDSIKKGSNVSGNDNGNDDICKEKSDNSENGLETSAKPNFPSRTETTGGSEEAIPDQPKPDQDGKIAQSDMKEENNVQKNEEKNPDTLTDQNKTISSTKNEEASSPVGSSSESQLTEKEVGDNEKKEDVQPVPDQSKSNPSDVSSTFSVSQALDALTGLDDSTQVAVNSVFGVIEDMITRFGEEGKENEVNERDDISKIKDEKSDSPSDMPNIIDHCSLAKKEVTKNELSSRSDRLCEQHERFEMVEQKASQNPASSKYARDDRNDNKDGLIEEGNFLGNSDRELNNHALHMTTNSYRDSLYSDNRRKYLHSKMSDTKSLDVDTTAALFLDYVPEEGQWRLMEQPQNLRDSISDVLSHSDVKEGDEDEIIEPSYIIVDSEKQQEPVGGFLLETTEKKAPKVDGSEELMGFIKNIIWNALNMEVCRRLSTADRKDIDSYICRDMELIANAVSLAIVHNKHHSWLLEDKDIINTRRSTKKVGSLNGEHIINAISLAVQSTDYLRRVLPVGVIVGSSLAALRKSFNVATVSYDQVNNSVDNNHAQVGGLESDNIPISTMDQISNMNGSIGKYEDKAELRNLNNESIMVGAVTAALGASAFLVHKQDPEIGNETSRTSSKSIKEKDNYRKKYEKSEEAIDQKEESNLVTSLAEKAMSVAGPVVPTKEDGEVDQDRLVAMLADLGQKGGMLKLVGKIALLWGGIRGAISLTDKLISFLRIAERPLFQRILGFVSMVLVLWSPVVVPLLPTLVQSWAAHTSSRIAELACIVGLYTAVVILVMLWGKRIREYENPFEQYGLNLASSQKMQDFFKGLVGGVMLVLSIQSVNALLGCVSLSWALALPSPSSDALTFIRVYGKMLVLAVQGLVTATSVAVAEELLFRSWLPEEIANDLGHHRAIIISGLAFSILQSFRSPQAIPGLWLLSVSLAGVRQRSQGSLSVPIGLRAGIIASSFFLQKGGFLSYHTNFPVWLRGTRPFQPFSGLVGFIFSLVLGLTLYPVKPPHTKKITRTIRE